MLSLFAGPMPHVDSIAIQEKIREIEQKYPRNLESITLPAVGNGSSKVFFLAEAPGPNDAANGEPFTGPFSQIFNDELLPSVGLDRSSIYLTNMVKASQPLGQPLSAKLIEIWKPALSLEIAMIQPELIVTMGKYAMEFFLPKAKISDIRGKIFQIPIFHDFSVPILFLIHPANAHRFPEQKEQIQQEFLYIKEFRTGNLKAQNPPEEFTIGPESDGLF